MEEGREADVAGFEVPEQHLVVEFAVALGLGEGQAVGRVRRDAKTVVIGLDTAIALARYRILRENERQQAARWVTGFDVRINILNEVVFILLRIVFAGLIIAALRSIQGLGEKRVRLTPDRVRDSRCGHEVAHVARIDEDLSGEDFAGERSERF